MNTATSDALNALKARDEFRTEVVEYLEMAAKYLSVVQNHVTPAEALLLCAGAVKDGRIRMSMRIMDRQIAQTITESEK